jgi:3-hydroxyisobutyrate dehydrogenase
MGLPMAKNVAKTMSVTVFDPVASSLAAAKEAGLNTAPSAEAAVAEVSTVISMLPNGKVASSLYLGGDSGSGLLDIMSPNTDILDCSTIDAPTARKLASVAAEKGHCYMDTPVSGGIAAAAAATLSFMVGGSDGAFERAKSVLALMGPNQFHAGPAGSGQVAKACNNMLLAIHMIGTSEALSMGARSGLDPAALSEIFKASSGRNWSVEVYNPFPGVMPNAPASNDYKPGFMVDLMAKVCASSGCPVRLVCPKPEPGNTPSTFLRDTQCLLRHRAFSALHTTGPWARNGCCEAGRPQRANGRAGPIALQCPPKGWQRPAGLLQHLREVRKVVIFNASCGASTFGVSLCRHVRRRERHIGTPLLPVRSICVGATRTTRTRTRRVHGERRGHEAD